jgi:hypothetical protein
MDVHHGHAPIHAAPPSPALLIHIRAGLAATLRRDRHRLTMMRCPPGQTTPAALALMVRIARTEADLLDIVTDGAEEAR